MATATEQELITQTARDYFEGWFDGDVERMDRVLHPDLVKRSRGTDDEGSTLGITTKQRMLEFTADGEGAKDGLDRRLDIKIEDVYEGIARSRSAQRCTTSTSTSCARPTAGRSPTRSGA